MARAVHTRNAQSGHQPQVSQRGGAPRVNCTSQCCEGKDDEVWKDTASLGFSSRHEKGGEDAPDNSAPAAAESGEAAVPGSNTSTLSNYTEKDSASSIASDDGGGGAASSEYDIVTRVLYGSRENVNIIHEIFRQVRHN